MSLLRPVLMLAVVAAACFVSFRYSPHHAATNADAFIALYKHLEPAPLVEPAGHDGEEAEHGGAHAAGAPLLALPLPAALAGIDWNRDPSDGAHVVLYNLQVFQIAAVLLILIAFSGVPAHLRSGGGDPLTRFFAGACLFVRDDMVLPNMKKEHAARMLPLFYCIFFFILFMNLMGLVPFSATATSSIFVTAALATITLGLMVIGGMVVQGPAAYWKNLVPHVPAALWPLLFVVELIGVLVKPFALTIRLFANMTGGHMVVLSFLGLIFFFAGVEFDAMGYVASPLALGFAVFIMIIEAFVAFVQAYVFTILSAIFVGASLHPEH